MKEAGGRLRRGCSHKACALFLLATWWPLLVIPQTLTVNSTTFGHDLPEWVEVAYSTPRPTDGDVIALYPLEEGRSVPNTSRVPIKYRWASSSAASSGAGLYSSTGTGRQRFRITNYGLDLVFVLFSNVSHTNHFPAATILAQSPRLVLQTPNQPRHIHLAYTQTPGSIFVQWTTRDFGSPEVRWGEAKAAYTARALGSFQTYTALQLCGSPANDSGFHPPGALNYAALVGLQPETRYYFIVGDKAWGFSSEQAFQAGPAPGNGTLQMLLAGSLGHKHADEGLELQPPQANPLLDYAPEGSLLRVSNGIFDFLADSAATQGSSQTVLASMLRDEASLLVLPGGMSFARGHLSVWDTFMEQWEPLLSRVPIMPAVGPMERDWPYTGDRFADLAGYSGGECGAVFWKRFIQPLDSRVWLDSEQKRHAAEWYSYDLGVVHFVHLSTEVDFGLGSPQLDFVRRDLMAVNRNITPWVVVVGGRGFVSDSLVGSDPTSPLRVAFDMRAALEDILLLYQVDLTFSAYDHLYARTCPMFKRRCLGFTQDNAPAGPVHVIAGNSGHKLSWYSNVDPPPFWELIVLEHGHLRCNVTRTRFACQAVSALDGRIFDEWELTKPPSWQPSLASRTLLQELFLGNTTVSWLEDPGIPSRGSQAVYKPVFEALQHNSSLLQSLYEQTHANVTSISALSKALLGIDTVVTIWQALAGFSEIARDVATNDNATLHARFYAKHGMLPVIDKLRELAGGYPDNQGVLYRSSRTEKIIFKPGGM